MRKKIIIILSLVLLGFTQNLPAEITKSGEINHLISDFFLFISQTNYTSAAELFHYPPEYSPEQRQRDLKGVALLLEAFTGSFGQISRTSISTKEAEIFYLQVGGGDLQYWQKNRETLSHVFQVDFSNYGNGFITFTICNLNQKYEIREVKYGLSASPNSSALLFKEVVNYIHFEPGH